MPLPPQSVLKTRARRVFGEFVVEDAIQEIQENSSLASTSLCYSPSPDISLQSELTNATKKRSIQTNPPKVIDVPGRASSASSSSVSSEKENSLNSTNKSGAPDLPKKVPISRPIMKSGSLRSKRRDLVNETQKSITTATKSVNQTLNAARVARKFNFEKKLKETTKVRDHWKEEKEEATQFKEEAEKMRHGLLSLQRQLSYKFQKARAQAEESEKQSRLQELTNEYEFNSQVYQEQQRKLKEERDRKRRESTQARAKLRMNKREGDEKLRMMRVEEDQALLQERNEGYNASHQCKKEAAELRRKSFAFRNGDARRIRELYDRIQAEQLQHESESIQLKLAAAADAEAYRKQCEEERRKSLAFRGEEARKMRALLQEQDAADLSQKHASYELKWSGEKDAEAYQKKLEKERRESLMRRNITAKEQRDRMEEHRMEELSNEQASINLKLDGERDVDAHRKKMQEHRRQSLAQRNKHAKMQRDLQYQMERDHRQKEHASFELKWAGEKDAEAYRRQLEKERQEDLKFRNKESFQHAKVMDELRSIAQEKEAESYMLKWAGERDAKEYLAKCDEERRKYLAWRNAEGRRHRQMEEEQRAEETEQLHKDELLRAAAQKDMDDYKKQCEERDRNSLIFRRKEANLQRLEGKRQQELDIQVAQSNRQLEDAAHWDMSEYIKECTNQRRKSLACRAKESRKHRRWEQKEADRTLERQMEDTRWRGRDRRQEALARHEERKRIALDALRHAGCSFNVNAFSVLRDDF